MTHSIAVQYWKLRPVAIIKDEFILSGTARHPVKPTKCRQIVIGTYKHRAHIRNKSHNPCGNVAPEVFSFAKHWRMQKQHCQSHILSHILMVMWMQNNLSPLTKIHDNHLRYVPICERRIGKRSCPVKHWITQFSVNIKSLSANVMNVGTTRQLPLADLH